MHVDVVIVGAGPAGLMLAYELRLAEVSVAVLEQTTQRDERLRAWGVSRTTAAALRRRGLVDAIIRHARRERAQPTGNHICDRTVGRSATTSRVTGAMPEADELLSVRQQVVETVLGEQVRAVGGVVLRGHTVAKVEQDRDGVDVTATHDDGRVVRCRAAYVIGCDGGRSVVRQQTGFAVAHSPATLTGYQALVTVDAPDEPALAPGWHRTSTGVAAWAPGPTRVVSIEFDRTPRDRNAPVTLREVQDSLRRTSGVPLTLSDPRSIARFTDHTLLAETFRRGRILLAGDAAHLHPPFGGQGLNLSILDAVNLGWKLAGVVHGRVSPTVLDSYDQERRPLARRAIRNSLADVALLNPDERMTPAFELYTEIKAIPEIRDHLLDLISLAHMRYDMGVPADVAHPLLGGPDGANVVQAGHEPHDLAAAQRAGCGVLLDLSGRTGLRAACAPWRDAVRVITVPPAAGSGVDAVLLRPDGYTAWVAPRHDAPQPGPLHDSLTRWFGQPDAAGDRDVHAAATNRETPVVTP